MIKQIITAILAATIMAVPVAQAKGNQEYPWHISVFDHKIYNPNTLVKQQKVHQVADRNGKVLVEYDSSYLKPGSKISFKYYDPYLGLQHGGHNLTRFEASTAVSDILEAVAEWQTYHDINRAINQNSMQVHITKSKVTVKQYYKNKWHDIPVTQTDSIKNFARHLPNLLISKKAWEDLLEKAMISKNFDRSLGGDYEHAYHDYKDTPTTQPKAKGDKCVPFKYRTHDASFYAPDSQCGPDGGDKPDADRQKIGH